MTHPTAAENAAASPAAAEFERQLATLIANGCPWTAGLTDEQFRALVAPLADHVAALPGPPALPAAPGETPPRIPFVLVVDRALVTPMRAAEQIERRGRRAIVTMLSAEDLDAFAPIESVEPPVGGVYLLLDVDLGWATRNDPPDRALPKLRAQGRSPLTLEEGIALVTHQPEAVATNAGFSLLGSRRGDRRVTAMWISRGSPKLGWCFAGAPHTWLGSASCGGRVGL
ncbi:MAG TPA: DUF5701 family protein [Conexibacter sp.]|nr:DUF5701 family protein [Conexibacter sp.]